MPLFRASQPGNPLALAFTLPVTGNSLPPKLSPSAYSSDCGVKENQPSSPPASSLSHSSGDSWGPRGTCSHQSPSNGAPPHTRASFLVPRHSCLMATVYSAHQPLKPEEAQARVTVLSFRCGRWATRGGGGGWVWKSRSLLPALGFCAPSLPPSPDPSLRASAQNRLPLVSGPAVGPALALL